MALMHGELEKRSMGKSLSTRALLSTTGVASWKARYIVIFPNEVRWYPKAEVDAEGNATISKKPLGFLSIGPDSVLDKNVDAEVGKPFSFSLQQSEKSPLKLVMRAKDEGARGDWTRKLTEVLDDLKAKSTPTSEAAPILETVPEPTRTSTRSSTRERGASMGMVAGETVSKVITQLAPPPPATGEELVADPEPVGPNPSRRVSLDAGTAALVAPAPLPPPAAPAPQPQGPRCLQCLQGAVPCFASPPPPAPPPPAPVAAPATAPPRPAAAPAASVSEGRGSEALSSGSRRSSRRFSIGAAAEGGAEGGRTRSSSSFSAGQFVQNVVSATVDGVQKAGDTIKNLSSRRSSRSSMDGKIKEVVNQATALNESFQWAEARALLQPYAEAKDVGVRVALVNSCLFLADGAIEAKRTQEAKVRACAREGRGNESPCATHALPTPPPPPPSLLPPGTSSSALHETPVHSPHLPANRTLVVRSSADLESAPPRAPFARSAGPRPRGPRTRDGRQGDRPHQRTRARVVRPGSSPPSTRTAVCRTLGPTVLRSLARSMD